MNGDLKHHPQPILQNQGEANAHGPKTSGPEQLEVPQADPLRGGPCLRDPAVRPAGTPWKTNKH